jgi:hypothetical protein
MADSYIRDLYVNIVAVGHDHTFRSEPRLVVDQARGTVSRAGVLDSATWTDQLPEIRRDVGFSPDQRRGVIVVDFDKNGSNVQLMNFDPVRGLKKVTPVEGEKEAAGQQ